MKRGDFYGSGSSAESIGSPMIYSPSDPFLTSRRSANLSRRSSAALSLPVVLLDTDVVEQVQTENGATSLTSSRTASLGSDACVSPLDGADEKLAPTPKARESVTAKRPRHSFASTASAREKVEEELPRQMLTNLAACSSRTAWMEPSSPARQTDMDGKDESDEAIGDDDDGGSRNGGALSALDDLVLRRDEVGGDEENKTFTRLLSDDDGDGVIGSSSGLSPHPWLVTDAFFVSMWYVLRYAGPALSTSELLACRAIASLSMPGSLQPHDLAVDNTTDSEEAEQPCREMEDLELLLRLLLRNSTAFTFRHLESRYGEWLRVRAALDALERRRFAWHDEGLSVAPSMRSEALPRMGTGTGRCKIATLVPPEVHKRLSPEENETSEDTILERFDGHRIAELLMGQGCVPIGKADAEGILIVLLSAVRVVELRTFLTSLLHAAQQSRRPALPSTTSGAAPATEEEEEGEGGGLLRGTGEPAVLSSGPRRSTLVTGSRQNSDFTAKNRQSQKASESSSAGRSGGGGGTGLPSCKRELILYFLKRDYMDAVDRSMRVGLKKADGGTSHPTKAAGVQRPPSCFSSVVVEKKAIAACWDTHVGDVFIPHVGLAERVRGLVELFHVITSNGGASTMRLHLPKPMEATMVVAAVPTLVMVRPQLMVLLQVLRAARLAALPSSHALGQQGVPRHDGDGVVQLQTTVDSGGDVDPGRRAGEQMASAMDSVFSALPAMPIPSAASPVSLLWPQWGSLHRASAFVLTGETLEEAAGNMALARSVTLQAPESIVSSAHCHIGDTEASHAPGDGAERDRSKWPIPLELGHRPFIFTDRTFTLPPPSPLLLFSEVETLENYKAALLCHRTLYAVLDGAATGAQRRRGRDPAFLQSTYEAALHGVQKTLALVKQHPMRTRTRDAYASFWRAVQGSVEGGTTADSAAVLTQETIEVALYRHGIRAAHLLQFTPLYRWFSCLELIYPLLQSARRYDDANRCLSYLLEEPIFLIYHLPSPSSFSPSSAPISHRRRPTRATRLTSPSASSPEGSAAASVMAVSPVSFPLRYKTYKRGEWVARRALNMSHLKQHSQALALLEEAQSGWSPSSASTAMEVLSSKQSGRKSGNTTWKESDLEAAWGVLTGEAREEAALPPAVARGGRLYRALWPSQQVLIARASLFLSGEVSDDADPCTSPGTSLTMPMVTAPGTTAGNPAVTLVPTSVALYHAAWKFLMDRYCRREDRLTIERLLASLHGRVRHWTPLAPQKSGFTNSLASVPTHFVLGVRDLIDTALWRAPLAIPRRDFGKEDASSIAASKGHGPAVGVEEYVLQHYLRLWRSTPSGPSGERRRGITNAPSAAFKSGTAQKDRREDGDTSEWQGLHCEGQWIAHLSHVFLLDLLIPPASPQTGIHDGFSNPTTPCEDGAAPMRRGGRRHTTAAALLAEAESDCWVWLSAFQDGPLDMTTPVHFRLRCRSQLQQQLNRLEKLSREELVLYVASRIKSPPSSLRSGGGRPSSDDSSPLSTRHSMLTAGEEMILASVSSKGLKTGGVSSSFVHAFDRPVGWVSIGETAVDETATDGIGFSPTHHSLGTEDASASQCCGEGDAADAPQLSAGSAPLLKLSLSSSTPDHSAISSTLTQSTMLPPQGASSISGAEVEHHSSCASSASVSDGQNIPDELRVDIGTFPLLDMLQSIPLQPLWALLRLLFLSPMTDGVPLRFSGFPDIVIWSHPPLRCPTTREAEPTGECMDLPPWLKGRGPAANEEGRRFVVMEVKSPSDFLSTKQISVNDMLLNCGFDVRVIRVEEAVSQRVSSSSAPGKKRRKG